VRGVREGVVGGGGGEGKAGVMTYGKLNKKQIASVRKLVRGRVVHDLGAGNLDLAHVLATMGAKCVIAIDEVSLTPDPVHAAIVRRVQSFDDVREEVDVAFLSWPYNVPDAALIDILGRAHTIIYLGKNTDSVACGTPALFELFTRRCVLDYQPDKRNTLIAYRGKRTAREVTVLRGEERAGLMSRERVMTFEEAESGSVGRLVVPF
jgi:hypothetical protein